MLFGLLKTHYYFHAIKTLLGTIIMLLFVTELNLMGFLYPYILSYFRLFNDSITPSSMIIIPLIWLFCLSFLAPIPLLIKKHIGLKPTIYLFICIFSIIHFLCGFISNFYLFAVVVGINGGLTQSCFMYLPFINSWRFFFKESKYLLTGIMHSSLAFSPFLSSYIVFWLINPENTVQSKSIILNNGEQMNIFDKEIALNLPYFFKTFALIAFVLGSIGNYLTYDFEEFILSEEFSRVSRVNTAINYDSSNYGISDNNNDFNKELIKAENFNERFNNNNTNKDKEAAYSSFNLQQQEQEEDLSSYDKHINKINLTEFLAIIKEKPFLPVFFYNTITFIFPFVMHFSFKTTGLKYLNDDKFVTFCGSIGAIVNGISRLSTGLLFKKLGLFKLSVIILLIEFFIGFFYLNFVGNKTMFFLSVVLFEITYGYTCVIILIGDVFFKERLVSVAPYLSLSVFLSNVIGMMVIYLAEKFVFVSLFKTIGVISLFGYYFIRKLVEMQKEVEFN